MSDLTTSKFQSWSEPHKTVRRTPPLMIQGELVALTGDPRTAAILGQLLYWSQQVKDLDFYLEEERNASSKDHVFQHGWFCKPAKALKEETMLRMTVGTFHRYLNFLIDRKWVQTRRNLENKWTSGKEYRVNLRKLRGDLYKKGCAPKGLISFEHEERSPSGRTPSGSILCEQKEISSKERSA